ncbi:GIY-YIG nuclease family protein [Pseudomonas sp. Z1-12]
MRDLDLRKAKIHLAGFNQVEEPIDEFIAGTFDEWQSYQNAKNFSREYLISLIQMPGTKRWLFAGVYDQLVPTKRPADTKTKWKYTYRHLAGFEELEGRLILEYARSGRQAYVYADKVVHDMRVHSLRAKRMTVGDFPGFKAVDISHRTLKVIVKEQIDSWRSALSSVAGVYLISDREHHMLYVGSATGEGGIWARWETYAHGGHGGNVRLKALEAEKGSVFTNGFYFSILEIADKNTGEKQMMQLESEWKRRLLTRDAGLNGN